MPLETINFSNRGKQDAAKFTPTAEELRTIQEKMQDPKFVQLFHEYMKSMEDPETRREEEAYLQQVEREAKEGGDYSFDFVFPTPGFVVELLEPSTSYNVSQRSRGSDKEKEKKKKSQSSSARVYVNMCSSEKIDPFTEETTTDNQKSNWHVPVSVSKPRTELFSEEIVSFRNEKAQGEGDDNDDEKKEAVVVYDAVFHPRTLQLADRSDRFCCFLVNIAVEHINTGYNDRHGFEFRRLPSRIRSVGTPQNQTITRKDGKSPFEMAKNEPVLTGPTKVLSSKSDDKQDTQNTSNTKKISEDKQSEKKPVSDLGVSSKRNNMVKENVPKYSILHRGHMDLTDTWGWKVVDRRVGIPEFLVVKMDFIGVQSAGELNIEVDGTHVTIAKSDSHPYHGMVILPFSVEPTPEEAKFERRKGLLTLVLRVVPPTPTGITAAEMRQRLIGDTDMSSDLEEKTMPLQSEEVIVPSSGDCGEPREVAPSEKGFSLETHSKQEMNLESPEKLSKQTIPEPQVSCIKDQDRIRLMIEKVQAARQEREKVAANANKNQEGPEKGLEVVPMVDQVDNGDHKVPSLDVDSTQQEETNEATKATITRTSDVEASEETVDLVKSTKELELLQQRQDAWRKDVQERMEEREEIERQAALRAEREARREAERLRKRANIAKLQEEAEVKLRERMAELPLSNQYIFAID
ncbi:PIH1 [Trypanosoma melophagium]|uniref:PIH1 n=1 Tax=Trypanosoma melophagium TaxID=715481 RepID=UPI003519EA0F|nr:PIH1 [Trypanosoma melophagium]